MIDNAGKVYILNNSVEKSETLGLVDIPGGNAVYEVVRIIRRVPLFLEDHYKRMKDSMKLIGMELGTSLRDIKTLMQKLVLENGLSDCNIKLVIFRQDNQQNLLAYISKSYYPSAAEVENGVRVSLLPLEREKPNAKVINAGYKERVTGKMEEEGVFEVLLVNKDNKITEGSKSNVFFVKGSKVYTAPGENVLKGITRQYIMDTCERLGVEVINTLIGTELLQDMDGLFISGTSIKVLPVSAVDGIQFKSGSNSAIIAIRDLFDHFIEEYIKNNRY